MPRLTRPAHLARKPQTPELERDGYAIVPAVLTHFEIDRLLAALDHAEMNRTRRNEVVYGARNLLAVPAIGELSASAAVRRLVEPVIGQSAKPVRALFFDKTPGANWPVLWHQDLSIAVAEKHDIDGWGPWTTKAGIPHVQPQASILEAMLTIRLHLDDCGLDNGPLRVLPGSHRMGRLHRERIADLRRQVVEVVCEISAGGALIMRPLLLHASSPSAAPHHRRVIHIEYASQNALPPPLNWAQSITQG